MSSFSEWFALFTQPFLAVLLSVFQGVDVTELNSFHITSLAAINTHQGSICPIVLRTEDVMYFFPLTHCSKPNCSMWKYRNKLKKKGSFQPNYSWNDFSLSGSTKSGIFVSEITFSKGLISTNRWVVCFLFFLKIRNTKEKLCSWGLVPRPIWTQWVIRNQNLGWNPNQFRLA